MSFMEKMRVALKRFMQGRAGVDQLGATLLFTAILLNFLSFIPFLWFLNLPALGLLAFAIYRALSRDTQRRFRENQWWLKLTSSHMLRARQALVRLKNRKQYKYFKCPQCSAKLKLPRGAGEGTVTCGQCGHRFRKKA